MSLISPPPPVAEVERIAIHADPVIRNLQITQCYYELSHAFTQRTGAVANWCTFATWASKQAGQTIRKQDLLNALEYFLKMTRPAIVSLLDAAQALGARHTPQTFAQTLWKTLNPLAAIDRASDAVARGNQKVFAEIGREFARFAEICQNDPTYNAEHLAAFCATLRPGDPPDGQQYLQQAFTHYYQAFFEPDAKTRAERLLLANLEIGFHEQTRLQPEIAEALDAAWVSSGEMMRRILGALFPGWGWGLYAGMWLMRQFNRPTKLDLALTNLLATLRKQLRTLLTEHMMVLWLPPGVWLRLGNDLTAEFPEPLRQITVPELSAMMGQIDPTPNSVHESGAIDWADLRDRIHFIADFFRCYEENAALLEPPFTSVQVAALKRGHLPAGSL
ncbi:MAG: hypothetical protein Fur0022_46890 [Anaerolineales bacterium]